jgi:hypothetical protein
MAAKVKRGDELTLAERSISIPCPVFEETEVEDNGDGECERLVCLKWESKGKQLSSPTYLKTPSPLLPRIIIEK